MPTLLLRLAGPMQAWGTSSRFEQRDTHLEPSKSGVVGLLAAALGRDRSESVSDLAALKMGVRVDKEGILKRDYHTAQGIVQADGKLNSNRNMRNSVSERFYLADAVFLVGLEHTDKNFLAALHQSLKTPHWPLSLGRKSFVPSPGVYLPDGLKDEHLGTALTTFPPLHPAALGRVTLRFATEDPRGAHLRADQPLGPFSTRTFGQRRVLIESRSNPLKDAT